MGQFVKYMVFGTHVYEIWKTAFILEIYMCFMHSKPTGFFVLRLPIRVSRLVAFAGHVSTGWNWTGWNKIWASHKNTLVDGSFFPLSHLIPIPLIFLHSVTEAIWVSHKNTLADDSFFPLSHLIPIPLIFLHFVTEAKQRTVSSFKKFLSFQFRSP